MTVHNLKQQMMMGGSSAGGGNILLIAPSSLLPTAVCRNNSGTMSISTCTTVEPAAVKHKSTLRQSSSSMIQQMVMITTTTTKQPKPPPSPRKCVRFAPQLEVILAYVLHRKDMTDQDIDDRFLMQNDVMAIRAHAKLTTKYYRLKDPQMMRRLDACFDQTTALVNKALVKDTTLLSRATADTTLRRCVDLIDRTAVDEWCGRLKFHGRGLERYCSEHQRTVRAQTIAYSRQKTVEKQDNNSYSDDDTAAERLAAVYRKWTRTAMVFALVMAQGDQRAARDAESLDEQRNHSNNNNISGDHDDNNRVMDIDNVNDDRLNETGRIAVLQQQQQHHQLQPVVASTTTMMTISRSLLSPNKQQHVLPRRKPSMLRRFKSTGAA